MWDVLYILYVYSPSVCLLITASIHVSVLVWVISGIFGEDGSFRDSDTVWEKVHSSLGWFFTAPTKRPYWAHLTLVEELSMSDVAWSSLIWTVLVFNCLHKTDGCWVTYSSIRKRKIWEGGGGGDRQLWQVVQWTSGSGGWPVKEPGHLLYHWLKMAVSQRGWKANWPNSETWSQLGATVTTLTLPLFHLSLSPLCTCAQTHSTSSRSTYEHVGHATHIPAADFMHLITCFQSSCPNKRGKVCCSWGQHDCKWSGCKANIQNSVLWGREYFERFCINITAFTRKLSRAPTMIVFVDGNIIVEMLLQVSL